ncbi:MAG: thiamine-phosphate kinase [Candidatus Acidiferrales bacterium]
MDAERHLIERIAHAVPSVPGRELRLGIGDDSALIRPKRRAELVLSCDTFLEGVHFLENAHPPESVGYKSLARAASDLAAMGATPRFFLMTLALPARSTGGWLNAFLRGLARAAREFNMRLAGGDTTKSATISIGMTVIGQIPTGRAVKRTGAQAGDLVYVSGTLGRAQLGLEIMLAGFGRQKKFRRLLAAHLYSRIPMGLGAWLANHRAASAMMDISDGLSTDLSRMCDASGVGSRVWSSRVPCVSLPPGLPSALRARLNPLEMALHGGDDYVLLFTVPRRKEKRLQAAPGFRNLTAIGEITSARKILLTDEDGRSTPLISGGWDPFRKK